MPDFENQLDYRAPFEAAMEPMAIVDASSERWRIRTVNGAFADAFDRPASTVRDEPLRSVLGFDPVERLGARPRRERETYAELDATGGEHLVRVRPFDRPASTDSTHALVVVLDAASVDRPPRDAAEPIRTLAASAGADDASTVCDGVAEILRDTFGFDAVTIRLDEASHLTNVEEPIRWGDPAASRLSIRHGVCDPRNGVVWGTVVQAPVADRGVLRVATHAAHTLDPDTVRGLESVCQYLDAVLDGVDRLQSVRTARQELSLFNRLLRHSVLNGLNLIRARLDLVESDVPETGREHYETASARVDDLLDRVEAIRKLQTGDESADVDAYRIEAVLDERLARARQKYPDASFSVVGSVPDAAIEVDALVHVCLRNVLRNAVQHADLDAPEIRVRVSADAAAGVATVRIADNGSGLPDDADRSLFEAGVSRFDGGGHGVGLSLTRTVVEDGYGGAVRATESERGGAEIVLQFPLADPTDGTPD